MATQLSSGSVDVSDDKQENLRNLRQTCEFIKKTWKEDMTLVVEGRKLFVSSSILAVVSPVFEAKFEEQFKEGARREVTLEDQSYDDVVEFLRCVYPNIFKPVSQKNVFHMLPLAGKFQVEALIEKCEKFLLGEITDCTNGTKLGQYLQNASMYRMEELRKKCVDIASEKDSHYLRLVEKHQIPKEIMLEIRDNIIKNLEHKLSKSGNDVSWLQREKTNWEASIKYFENQVSRLESEVKTLKDTIDKKDNKIEDYKYRLGEYERRY